MDDLEPIKRKIYEIRGQRVMLDFDLADSYGVDTSQLKRQVRRNIERFEGDDIMFVVTREELSRCQIGTLNIKRGQNIKYLPFAFTEIGVAMLSSVLKSSVAVKINRNIMRAFVAVRQVLSSMATKKDIEELQQRIKALEESNSITKEEIEATKEEIHQVYEALTELGEKKQEPLPEIGYSAIQKRRQNIKK